MSYPILPMPPDLWPAVREIYREGITTGNATFETELPEWEKWDASHHKHCRLIALEPRDEAISEIQFRSMEFESWAGPRSVRYRLVASMREWPRCPFT